MSVEVKICGLREETGINAAVDAGARYVGFVFRPGSTRFVLSEIAAPLSRIVPPTVMRVGLFVDAGDDELRAILGNVTLDMLQLHGDETPKRVKAIQGMTGLPVMKALRIATAEDLKPVASYEAVADRLLFDTRIGNEPIGGTGQSFDWNLLKGQRLTKPWMLAGGLKASNLAEAVRITGAQTVDISSGVENTEGHKDPARIREFIERAKQL